MSGFDVTNVVKTRWPSKKIQTIQFEKSPAIGIMPKFADFGGDYRPFVQRTAWPAGRSKTFGRAQANQAGSVHKKFLVDIRHDYALATISTEAQRRCRGDANALVDAISSEVGGAIDTLSQAASIDIYRNGGGARGRSKALSQTTVANDTIELQTAKDTMLWSEGAVLTAASTDGTSGSVRGGSVKVIAIDHVNNKLVVDQDVTVAIPGFTAASDYLIPDGDFGIGMTGFDAWLPASVTATAFWGVDRTANTVALAGHRYSGSGGPIDEVLIEAALLPIAWGGNPDTVLMNPFDTAPLLKLINTKVRYTDVKSTIANVGYEAIELRHQKGSVKILADAACPKGTAYMLQIGDWELFSMGDMPGVITDGHGQRLLAEAGADAVGVRVGYWGNIGCYNLSHQVRITL